MEKKKHFLGAILQALLIKGGLVETIVTVRARARSYDLNRLLRITTPLGQKHGSSLSPLSSCVHEVMDFSLRPPRLMPHLLSRISTLQRLETLTLEYLIREKEKVDYTE